MLKTICVFGIFCIFVFSSFMRRKFVFIVLFFLSLSVFSQSADLKTRLTEWVQSYENAYLDLGNARVRRIEVNSRAKRVTIHTNFLVSTLPFRPEIVAEMKRAMRSIVSEQYPNYQVVICSNKKEIDELVPNAYRKTPDKSRLSPTHHSEEFIVPLSQPYAVEKGLRNRNIALWHGHGWFYDQKTARWRWQRARYFEMVEDKFSASYVLQYLLPMLENAGANVFLPRERDVQSHEVVVDNDNDNVNFGSLYCETGDQKLFESSADTVGFGHRKNIYHSGENPFTHGSCRLLKTASDETAFVEWIPDIPEDGDYMVSVAYPFTPENVTDAHYTVYHAGGQTEFSVNQTMAFGTWIYLGKFHFKKGLNADFKVVLSNKSRSHGVVVADAVRFGGGMGNVARGVSPESCEPSNRPRYLEAATYWLQWAGVPADVYRFSEGESDYTDDLASRGLWVNWLNGGSVNAPNSAGLRVPLDLALSIHSDAGCQKDTVVGTLGVYSSCDEKQTRFPNRQSRAVGRDLADYVTLSFVDDVRKTYDSDWTFRGLWDKQYSETRRPEVPSLLLEMMSHQNFTDMQFGLDPRFKFVACRAIYKGILKFIAEQHDLDVVVQPLPVNTFSAQLFADTVQLSWRATLDTLEATAKPDAYIVYTRLNDGGFDNGVLVRDTTCRLPIQPDKIYSYKVVAVNAGGASFPSEILSVCRHSAAKHTVLVVNGFTRISAPEGFSAGEFAGFPEFLNDAVPYQYDISYVGAQHEFRRSEPWTDDDAPGWGASNSDFDAQTIAGNTFDFPIVHGRALLEAGYSFVSCSADAVACGDVVLSDYRAVDWILGEQKRSRFGNDTTHWDFKTFSPENQQKITDYCLQGGALMVTGAHVGTDLWKGGDVLPADRAFAENVLNFKWRTDRASQNGVVKCVSAQNDNFSGEYHFCSHLNSEQYCVESPDGIEPASEKATTVMRYAQNNISAAVAYKGVYRTFVCGFPFESLTSSTERENLMRQIMQFLVE